MHNLYNMLTQYNNITERGRKTQYKRSLAAHLQVTYNAVNGYIQSGQIPTEHEEKVKEFNKEFFK